MDDRRAAGQTLAAVRRELLGATAATLERIAGRSQSSILDTSVTLFPFCGALSTTRGRL